MARNTTPHCHRTGSRSSRGMLWMSERQLDAYLQTKETLRRLRAATSPPPDAVNPTSRGQTA